MFKKSWMYMAGAGVAFLVLLSTALGSFYTIDQGERGILLRNGKVTGVAEPGLGWKFPFIEDVKTISVRDQTVVYGGNTKAPLEAYSFDQQPATMRVSVTFRVPPEKVVDLYKEYQNIEILQGRVIERRTNDVTKNVFGTFTAVRAIQERAKLGTETTKALITAVENSPVQIVAVQIEEVGFSKTYEDSIEKRMLAQVQIETTRQQKETALVQAEIQVVQAKAAADAKRQQFTAEADGIKLRGEAEADAIRAKAQALAQNTNLVNLNAIDKWDGKLPVTQVPNGALPFIGVK